MTFVARKKKSCLTFHFQLQANFNRLLKFYLAYPPLVEAYECPFKAIGGRHMAMYSPCKNLS